MNNTTFENFAIAKVKTRFKEDSKIEKQAATRQHQAEEQIAQELFFSKNRKREFIFEDCTVEDGFLEGTASLVTLNVTDCNYQDTKTRSVASTTVFQESGKTPKPVIKRDYYMMSTKGFYLLDQEELVFLISANGAENEEEQSMIENVLKSFVATIFAMVHYKGIKFREHDIKSIGGCFFGDYNGFMFINTVPNCPVDSKKTWTVPEHPYLTVVFLQTSESVVAKTFGVSRMKMMLGHHYTWYPTPYWTDLERLAIVDEDQAEEMKNNSCMSPNCITIVELDKIRARLDTVTKTLGLDVCVSCMSDFADDLEAIQDDESISAFAIPLQLDMKKKANAHLYYVAGSESAKVLCDETSTFIKLIIAGVYLAIERAPATALHDLTVKYIEDGFVVRMKPSLFDAFVRGVRVGEPFKLLSTSTADSEADTMQIRFIPLLLWSSEEDAAESKFNEVTAASAAVTDEELYE